MSDVQFWIEETASGRYRWEVYDWSENNRMNFENGQSVVFEPIPELPSVFCTFVQYVNDDIVEIKIPPESDNPPKHSWFVEPDGNYYVHRGYIRPQ